MIPWDHLRLAKVGPRELKKTSLASGNIAFGCGSYLFISSFYYTISNIYILIHFNERLSCLLDLNVMCAENFIYENYMLFFLMCLLLLAAWLWQVHRGAKFRPQYVHMKLYIFFLKTNIMKFRNKLWRYIKLKEVKLTYAFNKIYLCNLNDCVLPYGNEFLRIY